MRNPLIVVIAVTLAATAGSAFAVATVGKAAPDFTLSDLNGTKVRLADFKGRHVVLEWHNPNCPFVVKHYDSGNMPALQARFDAKETVWLSINSTHRSHQDYMKADKLMRYLVEKSATPDAYLLDAEGNVGIEYAARTTPHMYVINPSGTLAYAGAIDDKRSTRLDDVKTARNYLLAAVEESRAGKPVSTPSTSPYGCSIKYK